MIIGVLVIFLGVILLLKNLGLIELPASVWSIFYPLVFIVIGLYLAIFTQKGKRWGRKIADKMSGNNDDQRI